MIRSGNPTLNKNTFSEISERTTVEGMTLQGTVNKCFFLLFIIMMIGYYSFDYTLKGLTPETSGTGVPGMSVWFLWGGLIGGLVFALITIFFKKASPFTSPSYALCEGLFLGAISAYYEFRFEGIVFQAITLTFSITFALLFVYKARMIRVTQNFRLGVAAATGGIFLVYLVGWIMNFFGKSIPYIHESGMIGIGFSLFVVVIASLNLVMDFDFIEKGAESGNLPKYMEWYGAFGLMVTLVWLYMEILHLLAKMRRND